jgi:DNA-binding transcriptional regulator YhcF (GntR family)
MTANFNLDKPIYRQIVDLMGENILRGEWPEQERIPAVREFAMQLQVNPNTVMRAYEHLQSREIVESRRGIGYFVAAGAAERIRRDEREAFMTVLAPQIKGRMEMLGITPEELMKRFEILNKNSE